MKTKLCGVCKKVKSVSKFHKHSRDGYQSYCKDCSKEISRLHNQKPERKAYNKKIQNKLKKEGYFKEYYSRPEVKKRKAEKMREYNKNPLLAIKKKARRILRTHKNNRTIKQQPCLICEKEKTEGHHVDYTKPLLVIWLCPDCHRKEHAKAKEQQ